MHGSMCGAADAFNSLLSLSGFGVQMKGRGEQQPEVHYSLFVILTSHTVSVVAIHCSSSSTLHKTCLSKASGCR